jgi:glycosyltransferase involved in cell wall biosynthesis
MDERPLKIAIVNLITRSMSVFASPFSMIGKSRLGGESDDDLNITNISKRLCERGNQVRVFVADAYRPRTETHSIGNPVLDYLPTRLVQVFPPAMFPFTPALVRSLRIGNFDVVQTGELFQTGTMLSWLNARRSDTPLFIWQELDKVMRGPPGILQRAYYQSLGEAVVKRMSAAIPRSLSARQHLLALGVPEEKLEMVVHSGVDIESFVPLSKKDCRKEFGIGEDRTVVLATCRLDHIKGLDVLLDAMATLRKLKPDVLLVIQGTGPEGERLRHQIVKLGVQDNVMLLERSMAHSDMPKLFGIADAQVICSRVDLFPFVAIEGIACGVPLATSFAGGMKTDIVDFGAGNMIRPDPEGMAEDLSELLTDERRLRALGVRGVDQARQSYDFKVCAARLEEIYRRHLIEP